MQFEWDEVKRLQNLKDHGIDFVDAQKMFDGPTFTFEDDRFRYEEQRFVTLGLLNGIPVSLAHTETNDLIRPISFRQQRPMKRPSSSKKSRTNYRRLRAMKDADILLTPEHPEANVKHIVRGIVRNGLRAPARKASISLRIDADVLEWFKAQGSGYQTRINAVLRAYREAAR